MIKKILVVDDDQAILSVVRTTLTLNGFEVLTNATGLNIPEITRSFSPDVILLDVRLPYKSGIEICTELKTMFDIPILLFSAQADRDKALSECDAEAFIQKPFDLKAFVSLIRFYSSYQFSEQVG